MLGGRTLVWVQLFDRGVMPTALTEHGAALQVPGVLERYQRCTSRMAARRRGGLGRSPATPAAGFMSETQRVTGKSTAWGVVAGISGSGAFGTWIAAATSRTAFPIWPAWALDVLAVGASYMCFMPIRGTWPLRSGVAVWARLPLQVPGPAGRCWAGP